MTNPTSNYGFVLPTATDLVTDLPADFDVALQGVDTRLKALQPGTTLGDLAYSSATANTNTRLGIGTNGQVLGVSAGVPAWVTSADQTPLTTKGDLFTFTTVDARIGVGANNTVLTADSAEATGLKWAAPAASGASWSLVGSVATTSGTTVTLSGLSGYDKLHFMVAGVSFGANAGALKMNFNSDTGTNYVNVGFSNYIANTYSTSNQGSSMNLQSLTYVYMADLFNAASTNSGNVLMTGCNGSGFKQYQNVSSGNDNGSANQFNMGIYKGTSVISSVSLTSGTGATFDAGTLYVYGSN